MTHDEAVKILVNQWGGCSDALGLVVALESMGVLKLDRPKKPEMRAGEIINAHVGGLVTADILLEMDRAGLQIIEKGQ